MTTDRLTIELDRITATRLRELARRRAAELRAAADNNRLRMSERAMTLADAGQLAEAADALDRALTVESYERDRRPTDDPRYQSGAH